MKKGLLLYGGSVFFSLALIVGAIFVSYVSIVDTTDAFDQRLSPQWLSTVGEGIAAPACGSFGISRCDATINCSSWGYAYAECNAGATILGASVKNQLSSTHCIYGTNWGVTGSRIWVNGGCRAVFCVALPLPPTVSISDSPDPTDQEDPYTVSWSSSNAVSCTVEKNVNSGGWTSVTPTSGTVFNGSLSESPIIVGSYNYRISCSNAVGPSSSQTAHTVEIKQPDFSVSPLEINEGDPLTIDWQCFISTNASGNANWSTGSAPDGNISQQGPILPGDYEYELFCENGGYAKRTVTVRAPLYWITAAPSIIKPGDSSTVSWGASGVNSCKVEGTDGFSDSSGDISGGGTWEDDTTAGPLEEQTEYTLTCETSVRTIVESVIININPTFEEF